MTTTVSTILQRVASYLNQDPTLPTGTDLTSWINFIDQSQQEWGIAYQWKQLRTKIIQTTSFSQTSIGLPSNFEKLMTPVWDYGVSIDNPQLYQEIRPDVRFNKLSTDYYCYTIGDDAKGYALIVNPPLTSLASLAFDIQVTPSSLITTNDTVTCPAPQYLVTNTIAKVLSARSDPRFTLMQDNADTLMDQMITEEIALSGGTDNQVTNQYKIQNFRPGESG